MKDKIFYLIFFVLVLAFSRIIPHPQNFTPILASSIMAPLLIKDRSFGIAIPVIAMFISDIFIGFHPYQFVIYSTLISIGILLTISKPKPSKLLLSSDALKGRLNSSIWKQLSSGSNSLSFKIGMEMGISRSKMGNGKWEMTEVEWKMSEVN